MALPEIEHKIAAACRAAGRAQADVSLVAVCKTRSAAEILPLLAAGHRRFGENRVQEAAEKWPALKARHPDAELHFIGRLQSNKAKEAVRLFDVIHTLDRPGLAGALKTEMEKQGRRLPCFIQVNTGEEPQKGGVAPRELERFYRLCREEAGLTIAGLMCIPPADELPDLHFALLRKLGGELGLAGLSMGMSGDFEAAIRYGATHLRIGSALFDVM